MMSSSQEKQPQLKAPLLQVEEGKVRVTGVLIDPLLCVVDVSGQHLVDETMKSLVGELLTSDMPFPESRYNYS